MREKIRETVRAGLLVCWTIVSSGGAAAGGDLENISPCSCTSCDAADTFCGDAVGCGDIVFGGICDVFTFDAVYTGEAFGNTRGGIDEGTGYSGLVDVVLRTDLNALGLDMIGGSFVLHGQNKHGPGLNRYVGSTQSTNIDSDPFTAMAEYFWERELADGLAVVRLGRQVGAIQFSVLDLAADFTYGAFQKSPNNPLPWYPNPTAGVTANLRLTDSIELVTGSFAGGPPSQLTSWGWSRDGKVYSVAEMKYHYSLDGLPGDIQNGYWYESGSHAGIAGGAVSGNYGIYFGWDQLLWNEAENSNQGLGTFFIYSWAPQDRNAIKNHFATGLVYRGLLPSRDTDVAGVGVSIADFSNSLVGFESEDSVELFYKIAVTDTAILQPALRYVSSPGGTRSDALTAGVRFGFEL